MADVVLYHGDCLDHMATMDANCVDTIITDPPYGLEFMGKDWDAPWKHGKPSKEFNTIEPGTLGGFTRLPNYARVNNLRCSNCGHWKFSSNPCACDNPQFPNARLGAMEAYEEWTRRWAVAALRVAKPGAMMLAFGGTRTHHRLMCAIEDAGWEIRDCMMWLYGSGFPKSFDISKGIDKAAGATREVVGMRLPPPDSDYWRKGFDPAINTNFSRRISATSYRPQGDNKGFATITAPATPAAATWYGWGTALKPAWEPIIVAMKPVDGGFVHNALTWGVAGLSIDGGRIGTELIERGRNGRHPQADWGMAPVGQGMASGRWPANLVLDEEAARLLDEQSGVLSGGGGRNPGQPRNAQSKTSFVLPDATVNSFAARGNGHPSRFFYTAKASRSEREAGLEGCDKQPVHPGGNEWGSTSMWNGENSDEAWKAKNPNHPAANHHPCVKPIALLRYLCRLTRTPTGGVVYDPFMGSGSTGIAAIQEGRAFIGAELDAEYHEIARRRIEHARRQMRLPLEV